MLSLCFAPHPVCRKPTRTCEVAGLFPEVWRWMSDLCLTLHSVQSTVTTAPFHHRLTLTLWSINHSFVHMHTACTHRGTPVSVAALQLKEHVYYSKGSWSVLVSPPEVKQKRGSETDRLRWGCGREEGNTHSKISATVGKQLSPSDNNVAQTTLMSQLQSNIRMCSSFTSFSFQRSHLEVWMLKSYC